MNITVEQFLLGCEKAVERWPGIIAKLESIDRDLLEEHIEQLDWMIESLPEAAERARTEGRIDFVVRMVRAQAALLKLEQHIER